jgi:5-methyltetrahydropteroyltriglutamate--homocysteine methyltransferase
MNIVAANGGSYPRIGDSREQQKLRNAYEASQRGDITGKDLTRIQQSVIREVLAEQAKAGLDVVSDGQITWYDSVSHVMGKLKGVSINGLLRYYDTNTYFRQPQVTGRIEDRGALLADDLKWARAVSARPVLTTLPGPLTLSRLSIIKGGPYANPDKLMDALVPVLADEVERLARAGADAIVIEESYLLREPKALPRLADALEVLAARKGSLRIWLAVTFGDAAGIYDKLQRLPVDGLSLDFTYSRAIADAVTSSGSRLALGLGLVDARNTKLESPSKVAAQAALLLKKAKGAVAGLVPSNGLEYLPRGRAFEKLVVLAKARDLLMGKKGGSTTRRATAKAKPRAKKAGRKTGRGRK